MLQLAITLLGGAYSLACFPRLPPTILLLASLLALPACWRWRQLRPVACFLFGFGWMGLAAVSQLSDRLDPALQGETLTMSALVEDFPVLESEAVRFVVRPIDRDGLPRRIRVSWFQPDGLPAIGETWRLQVRLKRPRGYSNPRGFDFEGWLFRAGIGATGYVMGGGHTYKIHGERPDVITSLRQRVVDRVSRSLPPDDAAAVLMAIAVGARHRISRAQWDLYARTGTSHLMAISGLHIGLAATFAFLLCRGLLAPFCSARNLRDLATNAAIMAAMAYAMLSGFAVPARRALLMALVAGAFVLLRRRMNVVQLIVIPCVLIFLTDPIAILTPGFKLSFAAVAILVFVAGQHRRGVSVSGGWRASALITGPVRLSRLQLALLAGLFPLTALIFGRFALIAPVINLLVLPLFNFVTVPLMLLGVALDGPFLTAGQALLKWAYASIAGLLWLVKVAGEVQSSSFRLRHLDLIVVFISLIPLVFVVMPPGWPGRRLALVSICTVLSYRPAPPPRDCIDYHVLDVGQGLAVVVQTARHALLFDTGPSFLNGSSTAELVIAPFLYGRGIDRLDKLVVSHGDLDHAGGVKVILDSVKVDEVMVGEVLQDAGPNQRQCVEGEQWHWGSGEFTVLHPRDGAPWDRNNGSCVLLVEFGDARLLLTGDIESPAEQIMIHRRAVGAADVVVVPHHGSLTSSSAPFVTAVRPGLAIVSAGFQNRWRFPRPEIVTRWEMSGATVVNTATMGAISQRMCSNARTTAVRQERSVTRKFWHEGATDQP
jgi:competence protein ComEC